ncbi:hypothetical protein LUZ60_016919 [Juncus effusus]|nr:hypothetical protein LUZ60_016919 [Juncus effusus]
MNSLYLSSLFHIFLLISTLIPISTSQTSIITSTCNAAVSANSASYDMEFCVEALSSVPGSESANIRGLSVIVTNLAITNVTKTLATIQELLSNLNNCYQYYKEMNYGLASAVGEIKQGRIESAGDKLGTVRNYPTKCDIVLSEAVVRKNPLSLENENLNELSALAYQITELITNQGFGNKNN